MQCTFVPISYLHTLILGVDDVALMCVIVYGFISLRVCAAAAAAAHVCFVVLVGGWCYALPCVTLLCFRVFRWYVIGYVMCYLLISVFLPYSPPSFVLCSSFLLMITHAHCSLYPPLSLPSSRSFAHQPILHPHHPSSPHTTFIFLNHPRAFHLFPHPSLLPLFLVSSPFFRLTSSPRSPSYLTSTRAWRSFLSSSTLYSLLHLPLPYFIVLYHIRDFYSDRTSPLPSSLLLPFSFPSPSLLLLFSFCTSSSYLASYSSSITSMLFTTFLLRFLTLLLLFYLCTLCSYLASSSSSILFMVFSLAVHHNLASLLHPSPALLSAYFSSFVASSSSSILFLPYITPLYSLHLPIAIPSLYLAPFPSSLAFPSYFTFLSLLHMYLTPCTLSFVHSTIFTPTILLSLLSFLLMSFSYTPNGTKTVTFAGSLLFLLFGVIYLYEAFTMVADVPVPVTEV